MLSLKKKNWFVYNWACRIYVISMLCLKFKFKLEKLRKERKPNTEATQSERPLVTISSIWCHKWKSNQVRPMKFSALLCLCFLQRCTFLEPHNSALRFYILGCGTFPNTLTAKKHLAGAKMPNRWCGFVTN